MSIIADTSVVLSWLFEGAQTSRALDVLRQIEKGGMLVPPLWWCELENGVLMGERRGRKSASESAEFLQLVRALEIQTDDAPRHRISDRILEIGRRHRLTAYDSTYIELASRRRAPLATFDGAMRKCAAGLGIKLVPNS